MFEKLLDVVLQIAMTENGIDSKGAIQPYTVELAKAGLLCALSAG